MLLGSLGEDIALELLTFFRGRRGDDNIFFAMLAPGGRPRGVMEMWSRGVGATSSFHGEPCMLPEL